MRHPARSFVDVGPAVAQGDLSVDSRRVVPPVVTESALSDVPVGAVELDQQAVVGVPDVATGSPAVDDRRRLATPDRQPVRAFDPPQVATLQRRLNTGVDVGEQRRQLNTTGDPPACVECSPKALRCGQLSLHGGGHPVGRRSSPPVGELPVTKVEHGVLDQRPRGRTHGLAAPDTRPLLSERPRTLRPKDRAQWHQHNDPAGSFVNKTVQMRSPPARPAGHPAHHEARRPRPSPASRVTSGRCRERRA